MLIRYKLKFIDYFFFNAAHQFLMVTSQVIYVGLGLFVYAGQSEDQSTIVAVIAGIIAYLAGWAFQLVINVFVLYSGKNRTLLTDHVIEIQPDCFFEENPFSKSFHKWAGIAKVVSRPGFVAVYINAHAAHIIPNRAFSTKDQRNDFLAQIRAKLAAVRATKGGSGN